MNSLDFYVRVCYVCAFEYQSMMELDVFNRLWMICDDEKVRDNDHGKA